MRAFCDSKDLKYNFNTGRTNITLIRTDYCPLNRVDNSAVLWTASHSIKASSYAGCIVYTVASYCREKSWMANKNSDPYYQQ